MSFVTRRAMPGAMAVAVSDFRIVETVDREAIEREVERLIAVLDALDGDPDLEPDDEDGEHDGSEPDESRPNGIVLPLPRYGLDQSIGPINAVEVERFHQRRMGAL